MDQTIFPPPQSASGAEERYPRKLHPESQPQCPHPTTPELLPPKLDRHANVLDLSYSKANNFQLWVQFLEKAYAKAHGCYQAISGGEVAEAFLDLTGCPTLSYSFDEAQEARNRPNIDWQEQIQRGILRGRRNISETP